MKGVKQCYGLLSLLFIIFGFLFVGCSDASAASIGTASFDLHYIPYPSNDTYQWENNILYGSPTSRNRPVTAINRYQWNTPSIYIEGTQAVIHFETNIVHSSFSSSYDYSRWEHLDSLSITSCAVNGNSANLVSKSVSSAVTPWTSVINNLESHNYTLTVYGDLVISGLTKNSNATITCAIGTIDTTFYRLQGALPSDIPVIWFEQNPMRVTYVDNVSDALLQMQNNLIQQQLDRDSQDREDLQNQVDDTSSQSDAAAQQVESGFSPLTSVIGGFVYTILHPPNTDCVIDADMGHMDLGDIDLCQLTPPPAIQIIATLIAIGFVVPFAYSLFMWLLNLLGNITEGS